MCRFFHAPRSPICVANQRVLLDRWQCWLAVLAAPANTGTGVPGALNDVAADTPDRLGAVRGIAPAPITAHLETDAKHVFNDDEQPLPAVTHRGDAVFSTMPLTGFSFSVDTKSIDRSPTPPTVEAVVHSLPCHAATPSLSGRYILAETDTTTTDG